MTTHTQDAIRSRHPATPSVSTLERMIRSVGIAAAFMALIAVGSPISCQERGSDGSKKYPEPSDAQEALAWFERDASKPKRWKYRIRDLGKFADAEVTALLLSQARQETSGPMWRREELARALGSVARSGVVDTLETFLQARDGSSRLRRRAGLGLGRQGPDGVARLKTLLREGIPIDQVRNSERGKVPQGEFDRRRNVREAAIRGLSSALVLEPAGAAEAARATASNELQHWLTQSEISDERIAAIRAFSSLSAEDDSSVGRIRESALLDKHSEVVAHAAFQLAKHAHDGARDRCVRVQARFAKDKNVEGEAHALIVRALALFVDDVEVHEPLLAACAVDDGDVREAVTALANTVARHASFLEFVLTTGITHKKAPIRLAAVRLLSTSGDDPSQPADPRVIQALCKRIQDKRGEVALAAVTALGACAASPEVLTPLRKLVKVSRDDDLVTGALAALHRLQLAEASWVDELIEHAAGLKNATTQAVALTLLGSTESLEVLPTAWEKVDSPSWRVRVAAYEVCRTVRSARSIPRLFVRVGRETGRPREDLLNALQALTARRFAEESTWQDWWTQNEAGFALPPLPRSAEGPKKSRGEGAATTVTYYELPLLSESVAFVVDTSGSMREELPQRGTNASSRTRLDEAKTQLRRVIEGMPKTVRFNIVFFDESIRPVFKRLTKANKTGRKKALAAVEDARAQRETDVHGALARAFADSEVDTIYLLSDGFPSAGSIQDPRDLAAEIRRWNLQKQVRIHCIALGEDSTMLQEIARDSRGEYVKH